MTRLKDCLAIGLAIAILVAVFYVCLSPFSGGYWLGFAPDQPMIDMSGSATPQPLHSP